MGAIGAGLFVNRRQRLTAYAMASVLLVTVGLVFSFTSWRNAVQRHDRELQALVVMGSQAVDTYFLTLEKSLARLGENLQKDSLGPNTWIWLDGYKRRFSEFEIVAVTMLDGDNIASHTGPSKEPHPNLSKEASFIDARERLVKGDNMVVSRPLYGLVTHAWLTHLRYGVRGPDNKLRFMIVAGLSQNNTESFWKDAPLPPGAGMGVVRDDMFVVTRYPVPKERSTTIFSAPATGILPDYLRQYGFPAEGLVRGQSAITGSDTTIVFRRLPHYPLTFFVNNPASNLRGEWWTAAWPTYLLILLLFVGGIAIIRWIGNRQAAWHSEREARVAELEDLTERLKIANTQLEETNAELEAFTYTVSHDLRAPVRAIDGFTLILENELPASTDNNARALLARVRASARRMGNLINDLLDLSRYSKHELRKERLDTKNEVQSVIEELGVGASISKVEIGNLPECVGDRRLLRQVWYNLIANALKYSAKEPQPLIQIGFAQGAYFVTDNGVGFDMEHTAKLFQVFSRLHGDNEFAGTGLGLAIVRRIVEKHGGRVWASGEVNKGASFFFTLEAAPEAPCY